MNIIGQRFGKLVVREELDSQHTKGGSTLRIFLCQCDCGRERRVRFSNLRSGNSKGCGSCGRGPRQDADETCINLLLGRYRYSARLRSFSFSLSRDEFKTLLMSDCHYCDEPPSNEWKYKDHVLVYNGIDRVDSQRGYEIDNVVPSCRICNRAKANMTTEEWIAWIKRLYSVTVKGGDFRG